MTERPSFLEAWHMNVRVRHVHNDWTVAKPREECQPFTVTILSPDNVKDSLADGIERAQSGRRILKSQLPSATSSWILSRSERIRAKRIERLYAEAMAS